MAESVVSFVLDNVLLFVEREARLLSGVKPQCVSLAAQLIWIRAFLQDAEKKRRGDKVVDVWVTELIDFVYDAQDVIDAYKLHLERKRTHNFSQNVMRFREKVQTVHRLGKQIEELDARAQSISGRKSEYIVQAQESNTNEYKVPRERHLPTMHESEFNIVGLQREFAQVAAWMETEEPRRQVISIVGMGGVGKTTLAEKIYKNRDVSSKFDVLIWVSVSQEYEARDLLLSAMTSFIKNTGGEEEEAGGWKKMGKTELKGELHKRLKNKRYLVVIDDIWDTKAWDEINGAFPSHEGGGRVLLTTRNREVALHADQSHRNIIKLEVLLAEESWKLFCRRVFYDQICPLELVSVGKEIVGKCGGLPLALVVIAGLLSGKERTRNAWSSVLAAVNWHLSQDSSECRQLLMLSYLDLPYELKPCFLYIGMYPEDFEIDARKLIRLWVAEGFIQARGNQEMEDVAEDYLEELVQRSLIIVTATMYCGGAVENFRIHDLLRDLAVSEGIKNRFLDIRPNNPSATSATTSKSSRRCGIHSNITGNFLASLDHKLRSLLFFHKMRKMGMMDLDSKFGDGTIMLLRVLDLENAEVEGWSLPKEIGKLFFLQYLGLRRTLITNLPTSIGNLVQLQTLDVSYSLISRLPEEVWSLIKLRHLFLNSRQGDLNRITKEFGSNVRTLEFSTPYHDRFWVPSNFLAKLGRLRSLTIWGPIGFKNDIKIMDWKNCFPPSLTEIYFRMSAFREDPSEILGSLPNLKLLYIDTGGWGPCLTFASGEFPELQYFHLESPHLQEWHIRDGGMPNLRHLEIDCPKLEILPDELRNITTLQKVKLPRFFKNQMDTNGPEWDKVKNVPSIFFYHR